MQILATQAAIKSAGIFMQAPRALSTLVLQASHCCMMSLKRKRASASVARKPGAASLQTADSGSRFVNCPVCGRSIPLQLINSHLDTDCRSAGKECTLSKNPQSLSVGRNNIFAQSGSGGDALTCLFNQIRLSLQYVCQFYSFCPVDRMLSMRRCTTSPSNRAAGCDVVEAI